MSGFRVSGVYPRNANVFGDHEYAPCFVTDRPLPNSQDETSLIGDIAQSITSATTETYNDTSELGHVYRYLGKYIPQYEQYGKRSHQCYWRRTLSSLCSRKMLDS